MAKEIKKLWSHGIRTRGCCCGHSRCLGFIQVSDEDISKMEELGYCHYIYEDNFGGVERKDALYQRLTDMCTMVIVQDLQDRGV